MRADRRLPEKWDRKQNQNLISDLCHNYDLVKYLKKIEKYIISSEIISSLQKTIDCEQNASIAQIGQPFLAETVGQNTS